MPVPVETQEIARRLKARTARPAPEGFGDAALRAAVAVLLHESARGEPELLFIERAVRSGDPWSGQMAFPGGRHEPRDADLQETAARETFEEVGVPLPAPIGRLDDVYGSRHTGVPRILVSPYVYALPDRPPVRPNHEVTSTVWVPLRWILHPDSATEFRLEVPGYQGAFPAFRFARYTVWGLTYRVLENLCEVLDRSLPGRPSEVTSAHT